MQMNNMQPKQNEANSPIDVGAFLLNTYVKNAPLDVMWAAYDHESLNAIKDCPDCPKTILEDYDSRIVNARHRNLIESTNDETVKYDSTYIEKKMVAQTLSQTQLKALNLEREKIEYMQGGIDMAYIGYAQKSKDEFMKLKANCKDWSKMLSYAYNEVFVSEGEATKVKSILAKIINSEKGKNKYLWDYPFGDLTGDGIIVDVKSNGVVFVEEEKDDVTLNYLENEEDMRKALNKLPRKDSDAAVREYQERAEKGEKGLYCAAHALAKAVVCCRNYGAPVLLHDCNRFIMVAPFYDSIVISKSIKKLKDEKISFGELLLAIVTHATLAENAPKLAKREISQNIDKQVWFGEKSRVTTTVMEYQPMGRLSVNVSQRQRYSPKRFDNINRQIIIDAVEPILDKMTNSDAWREKQLAGLQCNITGIDTEKQPIFGIYNSKAQLSSMLVVTNKETFDHLKNVTSIETIDDAKDNENKKRKNIEWGGKIFGTAAIRGCPNIVVTNGYQCVCCHIYPTEKGGLVLLSKMRIKGNIWDFIDESCSSLSNIHFSLGQNKVDKVNKIENENDKDENENDKDKDKDEKKESGDDNDDDDNDDDGNHDDGDNGGNNNNNESESNKDGNSGKYGKQQNGLEYLGYHYILSHFSASDGDGTIFHTQHVGSGEKYWIKASHGDDGGVFAVTHRRPMREAKEKDFPYLPSTLGLCSFQLSHEASERRGFITNDCGVPLFAAPNMTQDKMDVIHNDVISKLKEKELEHGDLAPRNVLIDANENITVIDWDTQQREMDGNEWKLSRYENIGKNESKIKEYDPNQSYQIVNVTL